MHSVIDDERLIPGDGVHDSADAFAAKTAKTLPVFRPERRSHQRYSIQTALSYAPADPVVNSQFGLGATIDISMRGIAFVPESDLPVGSPVLLVVDWPVSREDAVPLKLCAKGRVVRSEQGCTVAGISRWWLCPAADIEAARSIRHRRK